MFDTVCPSADHEQKRFLWAVAGGKGGTGKTFIAANLGLQLSAYLDVTLVDADLGSPNLHTFLGIKNRELTLSDFLYRRLQLEQVASDTGHSKLRLISGSSESLGLGNLQHFRKQRMLRQIRGLNSPITLLDIGAGTYFNCIDFFIIADLGILVINPEPASVENAYQFIRAATLRLLESTIRKYRLQHLLERVVESRNEVPRSIYGLLELVAKEDPSSADLLADELEAFRPCLIVNKVRKDDDIVLGRSVTDVVNKFLAVQLHFVGAIPFDDAVDACLKRFSPYLMSHPYSQTTCAVKLIAERLMTISRAGRRFIPTTDASDEEATRTELLPSS
ncbi:MAG: MinD/ParA family protein [Acidobacteria bacterium]|nr:MAG: MinD/ParA family protein [Acidobacteriota bacterium]